jgi:hypothetical protein
MVGSNLGQLTGYPEWVSLFVRQYCARQSWVRFRTGCPKWTRTGRLAFIRVYMTRKGLKICLYWTAPFLIKIYNLNYNKNSLHLYKMFYLLTTERRETGQASVWGLTITTENSVNKCAYCPGVLLLPDAKIRIIEIEVMSSWPANEFEAASRR